MPNPFKKHKPFISYRIYFSVDPEDTETALKYNFKKDSEYKLWYLDSDIYKDSEFTKNEQLKMIYRPFKAIGRHQYFL